MTKEQISKVVLKAMKKKGLLAPNGLPKYDEIKMSTRLNYRTVKGIIEGGNYFNANLIILAEFLGLELVLIEKKELAKVKKNSYIVGK